MALVIVHVLTYGGRRSLVARNADLAGAHHSLAELFFMGHDVITALRQIEEQQPPSEAMRDEEAPRVPVELSVG